MAATTFIGQLNQNLASDKNASAFIKIVLDLIVDRRQVFLKHLVMKLQFEDLYFILQNVNQRVREGEDNLGNNGWLEKIKAESGVFSDHEVLDSTISVKEENEEFVENDIVINLDPLINTREFPNGYSKVTIGPESNVEITECTRKNYMNVIDENTSAYGHEVTNNAKTEVLTCTYCNMTLTRSRDLQKHIRRIHEKVLNTVNCEICEKEYFKDDIKAHVKLVHSKEIRHKCELCDFSCFRKQDLLRHMRTVHNTLKYSCTVCDFKSPDKGTIRRHEVRVHSDARDFICNVCGKGFKEKFRLKSHFQISHGTEKFLCDSCGKGFPSKEYLKYHEKSHNTDKQLYCTFCEKGFVTAQKLKEHLNKHTGTKPFSCPSSRCNKSYTSSSSLAHHKKTCSL